MRNPISKLNYLQNNLNRDHKSKKSLSERERPTERQKAEIAFI